MSHEELVSSLHYDPLTGIFTWLKGNKNRVGQVAGTKSNNYWQIKFRQKCYLAHRLAWFYMTKEWPEEEVDHEDTNCLNNKWVNLRQATRRKNGWNQGLKSNNTSGVKGVYFNKGSGKWAARVRTDLGRVWLGHFDDLGEAALACSVFRELSHHEFARDK